MLKFRWGQKATTDGGKRVSLLILTHEAAVTFDISTEDGSKFALDPTSGRVDRHLRASPG